MKRLGSRNYTLISEALKITGSYDPKETMYIFEESLYVHQSDTIRDFLQWCHDNSKGFGRGNYEERFSEFLIETGKLPAKKPHGKLTLKKVKIHHDMSEETNCYSAELYEDGKLMAYVSNEGRGGCDHFLPVKGLKYAEIAHLENTDVELVIVDLLEEWEMGTKHQSNKLVIKKDGKFYTHSFRISIAQIKKRPAVLSHLRAMVKKYEMEGYKILNRNL